MCSTVRNCTKALVSVFAALMLASCLQGESTEKNSSSRFRIEPAILEGRDMLAVELNNNELRSIEFVPWISPWEDPFGAEVLRREWILTDVGDDYYRITNRWIGDDFSMAIANDGVFDKLQLAPSNDDAGQRWKLNTLDNGFCTLSSELLGEEMVLDVDASNPDQLGLVMRAVELSDSQQWEFSQIGFSFDICSGLVL